MKISEISKLVGLDISTIRFYERKGLIEPARMRDSKYRNYTEEDVRRLKLILLYRKLDFSIEEIRDLVSGKEEVPKMLELRRAKLLELQEQLMGSIDLCNKMILEHADSDLDVDYYLSYVEEAENRGQKFPDLFPVLDRITENLQIEKYIGFPLAGWILGHHVPRRLIAVFAFSVFVLFPVASIISNMIGLLNGTGDISRLVIWCLYSLMSLSAFRKMVVTVQTSSAQNVKCDLGIKTALK